MLLVHLALSKDLVFASSVLKLHATTFVPTVAVVVSPFDVSFNFSKSSDIPMAMC